MMIVEQLTQSVLTGTTIFSLGAVVTLWHPWLLPIILFSPLIMLKLSASVASQEQRAIAQRVEIERNAQCHRSIFTDQASTKEVRLFNPRPFLLTRLHRLWKEIYNCELHLTKEKLRARGVLGAVLALDRPIPLGYIVWQLLFHQITSGRFILYTQSVTALQAAFKS